MKLLFLSLLAIMTIAATVDGYSMYQTYIPNGLNVPNPCTMGAVWPGVGHQNTAGGGDRNPFGADFGRLQHVSDKFLIHSCLNKRMSAYKVNVHQFISRMRSSQRLDANQRRGSSTPSQSWCQFIDLLGMKGLFGLGRV
jgi:hypothetical protein